MLFTRWITKATNTQTEYVTLIAFQLQQWLQERPSMLRHTHTACLVLFTNKEIKVYKTVILTAILSYTGVQLGLSHKGRNTGLRVF
jgi:hypothetical protein